MRRVIVLMRPDPDVLAQIQQRWSGTRVSPNALVVESHANPADCLRRIRSLVGTDVDLVVIRADTELEWSRNHPVELDKKEMGDG